MNKDVQIIEQTGPACGTATLAMILTTFHANRVPPRAFTQAEIDNEIRKMNIFTAPVSAAGLARRWDVAAKLCNHVDFDLLDRTTRRGNVCQLLVDAPNVSEGKNFVSNLHYVVVDFVWEGGRPDFEWATRNAKFFNYGPRDRGRWVRVKDPQGNAYIIRYEDLEAHYWSNMYFGLPTGFSNFAIIYGDTEADLDVGDGYDTFDASAALVLSTNSAELMNAIVHTAEFYPSAPFEVIKKFAGTILGATAFVIKTPGTVLNEVSSKQVKVGLDLLTNDTNILKATAGVITTGVAGTVWVASKPVEWLGNGFGYIVDLID